MKEGENYMKKIALKFTYHTDLIIVPDDVFQNISEIRLKFDKWLYDKSNDHGYWVYIDGKRKAVSFLKPLFSFNIITALLCLA